MRTLGLIGGMSWQSSAEYYRLLNECTRERLGGLHSAPCLMHSFDFAEIEQLQRAGAWEEAGERLGEAGRKLQDAGAEILILCTNTMHRVAAAIEAAVSVPLLHIADPTAAAIAERGLGTVALLGTRFTMEGEFYRGRLEGEHGLEVLVPDEPGRAAVDEIIYSELVVGEVREDSRRRYQEVIEELRGRGAQGVILGCTEICLLIGEADSPVPLFDTTRLHAEAAVSIALGDGS